MSPSFAILLLTVWLVALSLSSLPAVSGCSGLTVLSTDAFDRTGFGSGSPTTTLAVGPNLMNFFPLLYGSVLYGRRIHSISAEIDGVPGLVALAAYTFSSPKTPLLIASSGAHPLTADNYRNGVLTLSISPHLPLKNASLPHYAGIYIAITSASGYNISVSSASRGSQMGWNLTASTPLPYFTQPPVELPWIGAVAANICYQ